MTAALLHDDDWINRMIQQGYFGLLKGVVLIGGLYNIKPLIGISFAAPLKLTE